MKRRWLASAICAAVAVVILLMLFHLPSRPPGPGARTVSPPIRLSPRKSDELAIRDPAPLFLPTRFNATAPPVMRREPGAKFLDEDANSLTFSERDPRLHLPSPIHVPSQPTEVLTNVPGPLALGIGQTGVGVAPVQAHAALVQVFAGSTGDTVLGAALGADAQPTPAGRDPKPWHPLEFLAAVDASGLVGPLMVTSTSGVDDVDNFFRSYLADRFRLGERLTPGFYRIVVGP